MNKMSILKTLSIALLMVSLLSIGLETVLASDYDMDYDPVSWPGTGGTYVVSAVSGQRAGDVYISVTFWGASYHDTAWATTPLTLSCWFSGTVVPYQTNDYGYISHVEYGTFSWARAEAARWFTDGNTQWSYSCYSRVPT
jgi:hypothetical protein